MQFDNTTPIYLQIADLIRRQIVSGELLPGEKIPSVRELAVSLKVNPNTITKSLAELEDEKLIFTERTNGKFVTTNHKLITRAQDCLASVITDEFFQNMQTLGLSHEQIHAFITKSKGGKIMHKVVNRIRKEGK